MRQLLIILMFFLVASSCNSSNGEKADKIKIFISWPGGEARPHYSWDRSNLKPDGIEPKIIEMVMDVAGLEYEYVSTYNFNGKGDPRIEVLKSGNADISIRAITINEERKELVLFSTPYYIDGLGILVKKESGIAEISDLKSKKVYAHGFTTAYDWCESNLKESELITDKNNENPYVNPDILLEQGQIDAYVLDYTFLKEMERQNSQLIVLPKKFTEEPLGIAISKENIELQKVINDALKTLQESGALIQIISEYEK
jgi:ABC-type amino acid transport substrate-binding protein